MERKNISAILTLVVALILIVGTKIIVLANENIGYIPEFSIESTPDETLRPQACLDENKSISEYRYVPMPKVLGEQYDNKVIIEFQNSKTCIDITLREYLIMAVMSEMPYTYEIEALKAQAIAARTYTLKQIEDHSRHDNNIVCNDPTHCSAALNKDEYVERYGEESYQKAYEKVSEAVISTDGVVITYNNELCTSVYHASSANATESSYNLWGTYTPYLLSVPTSEPIDVQTVYVSKADLFNSFDRNIGNSDNIILKFNDTGRCDRIIAGDIEISAKKIRNMFSLKSCDFVVDDNGEKIVFTVYGYGHGIGMSQKGANEMAKGGYNYSDILTHYYTGVEIEKIK
ncbi:MAG: stage II sporulation protein D [Ruminococcaceae bacterium]|nr:stage II sporulation protein D [Oscillospiraceae bacterium]